MSRTEDTINGAGGGPQTEMKLEVVVIPVSDVERTKEV
jgi:hypothetical protein